MSTRAEILVKRLLREDEWDTDAVDLHDLIRKEMAADPALDLETAKERAWQRAQAERRSKSVGEAHGLKPVPKGPFNKRQLAMGQKEEREHTTNPKVAAIIAKQHLKPAGENPPPGEQNYYSKLRRHVEPRKTRSKAMLMALAPSSSAPSSP